MLRGTFPGFVRLLFLFTIVVLRGMHHAIYQDRSLLSIFRKIGMSFFEIVAYVIDGRFGGRRGFYRISIEKCTQYVSTL